MGLKFRDTVIGQKLLKMNWTVEGEPLTGKEVLDCFDSLPSKDETSMTPALVAIGATSRSDRRFDRAIQILQKVGAVCYVNGKWMRAPGALPSHPDMTKKEASTTLHIEFFKGKTAEETTLALCAEVKRLRNELESTVPSDSIIENLTNAHRFLTKAINLHGW